MRIYDTTLGDTCDFFNGKAHEKEIDENGDFVVVNSKFISSDGIVRKYTAEQIFPLHINDIVMVMSDVPNGQALAKCYVIEEDDLYSLNQRICAIRTNSYNIKFLYYQLNRHPHLLSFNNGENQTNLRKGDILSTPLWKPKLEEQQQIVAILDEAFAAIDQAKANIEKNIDNAKELFQSKLNEIFSQKGDGWDNKSLGDVCKIIGGGTPSKANSQFYSGNIPWATVRDMKDEILSTTELCITEEAIKKSSTNVIPKDNVVIATRVGLGKVCILTTDTAINQDLRGVIPINSTKLSVPYLFQWFKSKSQEIINAGTGATVQGVKLPFVKSLEINIPPLSEQKIIVKQLEELNIQSKKLEELYVSKLLSLEELKKSILQKAFAGELTNKSVTA